MKQVILDFLKKNSFSTTTTICQAVGLHFYTTEKYLKILENEGKVVCQRTGKRNHIQIWSRSLKK